MKVDNPLTREFLLYYPLEAARVLEQVSIKHVVAFFNELPPEKVTPVMNHMLPEMAAACLEEMTTSSAAKLVTELPVSSAARIYRLLSSTKQKELSGFLADKTRGQIRRHLEYPPESAGNLLDPEVIRLPENVTVAEAMRRIKHLDHAISCEIYIIDDAHHLTGIIDLGKLLTSNHDARLRDIMSRKTQPLSTHASAKTLLAHPGWSSRRRLPVVERDNTLAGVLDYSRLREAVGETEMTVTRDPLENLLSLAGLYWLSVAQLLSSLFNIARQGKGEKP